MKVLAAVGILLIGTTTSASAQAVSADEGRRVWGYVFAAPAIGEAPTSEQVTRRGNGCYGEGPCRNWFIESRAGFNF